MNPPDTFLSSARPAHAVSLWRDGPDILVEFPSKIDNAPYIMRIAPTGEAVAKVLDLVRGADQRTRVFAKRPLAEHRSVPQGHVARIHPLQDRKAKPGTEEQRANARALLKRMGIT